MFTGIVEDVGVIRHATAEPAGRVLHVECRYRDLVPGESIAVAGVCLTVRECRVGWFAVGAVETTLGRTNIGGWSPGRKVNLERAVRVGDRLGGHLVLGHVDGVGVVEATRLAGDALLVDVSLPPEVAVYLVPHGSITIDGVSLTVNAIGDPASVQVSLVDYTRRHTTLGSVGVGDPVHVEADVIGKYLRALAAPYLFEPGTRETSARSDGAGAKPT